MIELGDVVEFETGVLCKVVPDGEAVLYQDKYKMTITDVEFYLEAGAIKNVYKKYLAWS